jgi:hypothetical protein
VRVFLSFHSPDRECALALKAAIEHAQPGSEVFVDQSGLRYGQLWQPALFDAIAKSTAFIILVSNQLGDWQKVEYYEARDRKAKDDDYLLLPIIIADKIKGPAANLPGLAQLHWIETTEPASPEPLARIIAALSSNVVPKPPEPWRIINPYRGLLALEEQDADFFFGRDLETADVLGAVINKPDRLIALIGNSGVGKSSLAQAGVIGSLKRQRWPGGDQTWPAALRDSRSWAFLSMRPGEDPVKALASTFVSLWFTNPTDFKRVECRDKWAEPLKSGETGISDLIETTDAHFKTELGLEPPRQFFLHIDQGEELYSRAPKDRIASFSKLVAHGLRHPRLVAMTSQRSNYYGELQANEALFPLSERIDVPPLGAEALRTVLREPARMLGVKFESEYLIDRAVASAEEQLGALPLLADLFTDLWERMLARGDATLRVTDPREVIQVGAGLNRRADEFVKQNPASVEGIRRLFTLELVNVPRLGEVVPRRMVRTSERDTEWQLAQTLAGPEWRLVVVGEHDGRQIAELASDALLRTWLVFKSWLEEDREFLIWRTDLEARLMEYEAAPNRLKSAALLMGLSLFRAEKWLKARASDISPVERIFIETSIQRSRRFRRWFDSAHEMLRARASNIIFISYRRDDSKWPAKQICDALLRTLRREQVFIDIDSIQPGADFRRILEEWVNECEFLLALIGPNWISASDPATSHRRLDDPNDFVRIEIRAAFSRAIPVVPILLDGAPMPKLDQLPKDMAKLVNSQAEIVELRTFNTDVERIIKRLGIRKSGLIWRI